VAITTVTFNRKVQKFTLAPSTAGTVDIPIADGVAYKLDATVIGVNVSGGNTRMFHKQAIAEVCNQTTGAPGFETPAAGQSNPVTSVLSNAVVPPAFVSGGGSDSTIAWSISGANARLTISNNSLNTNDFAAIVDITAVSTV
jgi:hypothetical protein